MKSALGISSLRITKGGWEGCPDLPKQNYSDIGEISMQAPNYLCKPAEKLHRGHLFRHLCSDIFNQIAFVLVKQDVENFHGFFLVLNVIFGLCDGIKMV